MLRQVDDLDKRLAKGEFEYLKSKYPKVSFNYYDWNHVQNKGEYLYATEGYITIPENYEPNIIRQYKALLTPNSKFKTLHPELNIIVTNGPIKTNDYWELDEFIPFEQKINGICSLNNIYRTGRDGDIIYLREAILNNLNRLNTTLLFKIDAYGPKPYTINYKGSINSNYKGISIGPGHINNLNVISRYKFCFCPEPMYHELWSWDWVTERIFNCFKCKTVPIYFGCWNIEEKVPKHLFLNYKNFKSDQELLDCLYRFPKKQYIEMTEDAYVWNKQCRISNIEDLEQMLRSLK